MWTTDAQNFQFSPTKALMPNFKFYLPKEKKCLVLKHAFKTAYVSCVVSFFTLIFGGGSTCFSKITLVCLSQSSVLLFQTSNTNRYSFCILVYTGWFINNASLKQNIITDKIQHKTRCKHHTRILDHVLQQLPGIKALLDLTSNTFVLSFLS